MRHDPTKPTPDDFARAADQVYRAGVRELTTERDALPINVGTMQATAARLGVVGTLEAALRTSDRNLARLLTENALTLLKGGQK